MGADWCRGGLCDAGVSERLISLRACGKASSLAKGGVRATMSKVRGGLADGVAVDGEPCEEDWNVE